MSNVGDFIKERRLAKGMSKRALAEKAGISHSEVHRIENGERQNPSVPMLIALADALGIPQDDILMLAGYKTDGKSTPLIERVCFLTSKHRNNRKQRKRSWTVYLETAI